MVVLDTLAPPSGSPSSCTTSSPCRSRRLPPSWTAPRPLPATSPAAPADGSTALLHPGRPISPRQRQVVDAFLAALRDGDFGGLLAVLDPDVVFRDDSAAPPAGAPSLMRGARAVAGYALTYSRQARFVQPALVNRTSDPERPRHVDLAAARC